ANPSPPFQVHSVKLDFPRFDGSDVLQWIFKVEQFFSYYNTPDDQRLIIAAIHLDKDVVPWYQMMTRMSHFTPGLLSLERWSWNLVPLPMSVPDPISLS
ncbi:hypothetical protein VIGAN_08123700, partial [Vigna angularis var. angularis]